MAETEFLFRMRAYAAAHLEWDERIEVQFPRSIAILQSEYTGGENNRAYPVTIHGQIRGLGESIDEAQTRLANTIGRLLPVIALAANAAVADALPISIFGTDLSQPRPLIGYRTPEASKFFPPGKRRIDLGATEALIGAVGGHPKSELLQRAIASYRQALGHFFPEEVLLSGEFLYIAAETTSRFLVESRAAAGKMTPKNLARAEGASNVEELRARFFGEMFADDTEARTALEKASNGFEHGYMELGQVRDLMQPVLERSFAHVRRAMVEALELEKEAEAALLGSDFEEPRALVPVIQIVKGKLARKDPEGGGNITDASDVSFGWSGGDPVAEEVEGEVNLSFPTQIKILELPDNVEVQFDGFGMRAAHVTKVELEVDGQAVPDPEK